MATKKTAGSKPMSEPLRMEIPLAWIGLDVADVRCASHFLAQYEEVGDTHLLSFGMVSPPPILGTIKERTELAEGITHIPINLVAKVSLTPKSLDGLIDVLQRHRKKVRQRNKDAEGGEE